VGVVGVWVVFVECGFAAREGGGLGGRVGGGGGGWRGCRKGLVSVFKGFSERLVRVS